MFFEKEFINEVMSRADIVSVIQEYVSLKKSGSTYFGLCPFHQEKTSSFAVNKKGQYFHCLGCTKGGDVFKFLQLLKGLSFPDAVLEITNKYGITIPEQKQYSAENKKKREETKKKISDIVEVNKLIAQYWKSNLHKIDDYVYKRGISKTTADFFDLGFSDSDFSSDCDYLKESNIDSLSYKSEKDGKIYDRFRNRLIFPITDEKDSIVAFGGRAIDDNKVKYLNSPETEAYTKGDQLFGLSKNKEDIRKLGFAIIVEGYMDLISLYETGIRNVVASLGVAFTENQARLLKKYTNNVVINFDGDKAGIAAARRAITPLISEGFNVKVFVLPEGKDPDDYVRKEGARNYQISRKSSVPFLEFFLQNSESDSKSELIEEAVDLISLINNPVEKRDSFDKVVSFFSIKDVEYKNELWKIVKLNDYKPSREFIKFIDEPKPKLAEKRLLELMLSREEIRSGIAGLIKEEDYSRLVMSKQLEEVLNGNKIDDVRITKFVIPEEEELYPYEKEALDCLKTIRLMAFDSTIKEISSDIVKFQREGNKDSMEACAREHTVFVGLKRELLGSKNLARGK